MIEVKEGKLDRQNSAFKDDAIAICITDEKTIRSFRDFMCAMTEDAVTERNFEEVEMLSRGINSIDKSLNNKWLALERETPIGSPLEDFESEE